MYVIKEKTEIEPVLNAHIWATGQKIEQNNQCTNALKACGFLKEPKTANIESRNPKMVFPILPEPVCSSNSNIQSIDACKIEEKVSSLLRNKNVSRYRSSRILTEKHLKTIPGRIIEFCSCLLMPEAWN